MIAGHLFYHFDSWGCQRGTAASKTAIFSEASLEISLLAAWKSLKPFVHICILFSNDSRRITMLSNPNWSIRHGIDVEFQDLSEFDARKIQFHSWVSLKSINCHKSSCLGPFLDHWCFQTGFKKVQVSSSKFKYVSNVTKI